MPPSLRPLLPALLCAGLAHAEPMKLADYLALSGPAPTLTLAYGKAPSQYAELFRPSGPGPFPVAVLVHGGCWTRQYGGIVQLRNLAGALQGHGIAVWNVEYRRVDEAGGGYPGTYQDLNAALDLLGAQATAQQLDLRRMVAIGHSAGGQLVQWLAGRSRIAASSPLFQSAIVPVSQIISLGGLADLRREQALIKSSCERDLVDLTGLPSAQRPDVFADTNAAELIPNGSHTTLITGELDTVSPPRVAHDYAARARAAGDRAEVIILPGASHYDEVAAGSPSFRLILPAILRALALDEADSLPKRNRID
ncbi:alpha/beta hydrolase family protein [Massilia sp. DWR3-1-1]|uniref:alpha/beta hydrolase family protein n=1 Tax=Massilia sp. DWR3-1-1 TaxID=2804559 RepID=UPI003CF4F957